MGDANRANPEPARSDDEVKVLVTGYGPFLDQFPVNSSWSIASTLPSFLPATPEHAIPVRIKTIPEPLNVCYNSVEKVVPELLANEDYDIIFHMGLAAGRKHYTLERQSFREPYWRIPDVEGKVFSKDRTERVFGGCPAELKPTFNTDDVWRRWRSNVSSTSPEADVRPSDDPGSFLCGFIYYYSMSWFWKRQCQERPVMFLHVPNCKEEKDVEVGRQVAIGLIRACVDSRAKIGVFEPLKPAASDEIDHVMGAAEIGKVPAQERWAGK